jgi:hypothetical protein
MSKAPSDCLLIDRAGPGANFEARRIEPPLVIRGLSPLLVTRHA